MSLVRRLTTILDARATDEIMIDAASDGVWQVYTDVERWPEWTASVTSARVEVPGPLRVGTRVRIKQPWLPPVTWTVTAVESGRSWTWVNRSPGASTTASHHVSPVQDGRTHVAVSIEQRGLLGRPVGWAVRHLTRRYLRLEAEGLRRCSEGSSRNVARSTQDRRVWDRRHGR